MQDMTWSLWRARPSEPKQRIFPTNRLQRSQIQRGPSDSRTECMRTTESHALYRTAPSTVLLGGVSQTPGGCVGNYAGGGASNQTHFLGVTLVFLIDGGDLR